MRALVTGAAGFGGSHLCAYLLNQGNYVIAAVRPSGSRCRLQPLLSRLQMIECDLLDRPAIARLFEQAEPEAVFHLAGYVLDAPEELYRVNVFGSLNVLSTAAELKSPPKMVFIGSSAQYGYVPEAEFPITEATLQLPLTHYGASKLMQEIMALKYVRVNHLPVILIRSFNQTGPGEPEKFVCSEFARQIVDIERGWSQPILRVGNLSARRDFTDVRDAVRAYVAAYNSGQPGDIFNVCSARAIAISEVLNTLIELAGIKVRVESDPSRMQTIDLPAQVGSYHKLKERSRWEPSIPFEQTLRDLLDDWRRRIWKGGLA